MNDFLKFVESMYPNLSKEERMARLEFLVKQDALGVPTPKNFNFGSKPCKELEFETEYIADDHENAERFWADNQTDVSEVKDYLLNNIEELKPELATVPSIDGRFAVIRGKILEARLMELKDSYNKLTKTDDNHDVKKSEVTQEQPTFKPGDKVMIKYNTGIESEKWFKGYGLKEGGILTIIKNNWAACFVEENSAIFHVDWLELAEQPKFKPGDKVRITDRTKFYAYNYGIEDILFFIGKLFKVEKPIILSERYKKIENEITYRLSDDRWDWPEDCLELVNE